MASKLRVAVLGCGGIIGQHMMISVPEDIEPLFVRKHPFPLSTALDLEDRGATKAWLNKHRPDVIVNLAGESRPDVVESEPKLYRYINADLPEVLARWCDQYDSHLIQVSSQAVFSGKTTAPYVIDVPLNSYGRQKAGADYYVPTATDNWTIVRPTFVLGIRPFPALGRENPAEAILAGAQKWQVDNRWFSVSFAWDVAAAMWQAARERRKGVIHCGNPERLSRYELAKLLSPEGDFTPISHEALGGVFPDTKFAERPLDTTYAYGRFSTPLDEGLEILRECFKQRATDGISYRAAELATFLRWPISACKIKLAVGFTFLHEATSEDFRSFMPEWRTTGTLPSDAELIDWYRQTEAYLWELTAYHCDPGFNYEGMCAGIVATLKEDAARSWGGDGLPSEGTPESHYRVLCLGDGVGTLTIRLKEAGFQPVYNDLGGSRTFDFACARFQMRFPDSINVHAAGGFTPPSLDTDYDAVVSLDFLEHVPNVEEWARAAFAALKPGGLLCAVNRFECGSAGEIPMHLRLNDRYATEWEPLLASIGFEQVFADDGPAPDWHRKPL